ncbi:uncharacterized protein PV07_07264 [Cladophialophora immunda]|uniref:PEBP-like protein n=1 Tax=Cladophialophora immunda TaxID=569365 RepID=A0A0D2CV43_9EURO|nr:uncharacterized protein PV07_07264 [Cladophialophora immunda]KIW27534.1 hypothetical protein PV07_07264 [Cladophialophora immunda]
MPDARSATAALAQHRKGSNRGPGGFLWSSQGGDTRPESSQERYAVSKRLVCCFFGAHPIFQVPTCFGVDLPLAARPTPTLSLPTNLSTSKTYLAISIDLDARFRSFNILSPLLHWIQSDLTTSPTSSTLSAPVAPIASWIPPSPPGPSGPHRYGFLLYE